VEVIIQKYRVPEEIAAVTLLAIGDALPEISLNTVSVLEGTAALSLPETLGSALIAFGLIPPICVAFTKDYRLKLLIVPIVRETLFYLVGLLLFLVSMEDGVVHLQEALLQLSVYLVYLSLVLGRYYCLRKSARHSRMIESTPVPTSSETGSELDSVSEFSGTDLSELENKHQTLPSSVVKRAQSQSQSQGMSPSSVKSKHLSSPVSVSSSSSCQSASKSPYSSEEGSARVLIRSQSDTTGTSLSLNTHPLSEDSDTDKDCEYKETDDSFLSDGAVECALEPLFLPDSPDSSPSRRQRRLSRYLAHAHTVARHLVYPVDLLLDTIMPPLHTEATTPAQAQVYHLLPCVRPLIVRTLLTLLMCLMMLGTLSSVVVTLALSLVSRSGIGMGTLGATLVALGSEIPDIVSSSALAKKGYHDGALAGAIGSQIVNISVGISLPALLICIIHSSNTGLTVTKHDVESVLLLMCLLVMVVMAYLIATLPLQRLCSYFLMKRMSRRCTSTDSAESIMYTYLHWQWAIFLVCVWAIAYSLFISNNE